MIFEKIIKRSKKILGMNSRILEYIRAYNPKDKIRIADNKLKTKKILAQNGINVPQTFSVIRDKTSLNDFDWTKLPKSFVLKPNKGFGGEGILIVYGRNKNGNWIKADGSEIRIEDLKTRALNILDGNYSIANTPDTAFFEERIKILPLFKTYTFKGTPDIRIIVYNRVPIMAMLRLPTKESEGKANLHLGAIGVGIDIETGKTTNAILHGNIIKTLPRTPYRLRGVQIPDWDDILSVALRVQRAIRLGFLGVDIAIDRDEGPMVLEVNARPGLSIQVANLAPLKERLERVAGLKIKSIERGIEIAKSLFSKEKTKKETIKKIISVKEMVQVVDANGEKHNVAAKIDTGAWRTSISEEIAKKLGLEKHIYYKKVRSSFGEEIRPIIELVFVLNNKRIKTDAFSANRESLKFDMIIGRRDLKDFLIDVKKTDSIKDKK